MKAIFKHELRAYFNSPVVYVVISLFTVIASVYYYIGNISGRSADLSKFFDTMGIILLFIIPILTSRTISEDRKTGMEVLVITSPARLSGIITGKFLAVFSVFLLMAAVTIVYPLLLLLFAKFSILTLAGSYIGFILLGAAITAFGIFASSLTESQVTAAIVSFAGLLVMLIIQPIGAVLGGNLSKVLNWFSIFSRYEELNRGIFSLSTLLYYFSFVFIFLFLTVQISESRRWSRG